MSGAATDGIPNRVLVVGAGVSGLAAAWRLQRSGVDVTVLEADAVVGGKTAASRRDGFVLNRGATVLSESYEAMLRVAQEAGVAAEPIRGGATVGVVHDGDVHLLRAEGAGAVVDFLRTPLLSRLSKLLLVRAAVDAVRARGKVGYQDTVSRGQLDRETVEEYCDRRLNAEIRDRLIYPLLGGLFLTDPSRLSVTDLFFSLTKLVGGGLLGYRGGIDFFARALADQLDVRTGARVLRVQTRDGGATVRWCDGSTECEEHVDGVVLSVAAPEVLELYPGVPGPVAEILRDDLEHANFVGVRFALSRRPASRAQLIVAPAAAFDGLATVAMEHDLGSEMAPDGKAVVGVLFYDEWSTPRLSCSDAELIDEVTAKLERVVPGIACSVEFAEVARWAPGSLRTARGTYRTIARLHEELERVSHIQLAGDYLGVPSVNGSVIAGEEAARRLMVALGAPAS